MMNKVELDKDLLKHLYVDEELAINKIAVILNASVGKVYNTMKKTALIQGIILQKIRRRLYLKAIKGGSLLEKGNTYLKK